MSPSEQQPADTTEAPAPGALTISVEQREQAVVLSVGGEIDLLTAPQLEESVSSALLNRPAVLVIDLTGVGFLASAGMGVLVAAQEQATGHTRLRVVATGPDTFRPMDLTGVNDQLTIYPTAEAALKAE